MLALLLLLTVPAFAETVELVRDAYGHPHIFAQTPAGAAFGAGYAQAQDRPAELLANLNATAAEPEGRAKLVAQAFAKGINTYFREQKKDAPEITAAHIASFAQRAYMSILSSNDLLVSGSRTNSRAVIAILDPMMQITGPMRPYEMTLYAKEGDLAIAGVAPVGMPFPIVGHTQFLSVGWSGDAKPGGEQSLEEAWELIASNTLEEARRALAMNQIQGHALIGTRAGEIYDSSGAKPADGYLHRASNSREADGIVLEALRVQTTWSFGRVQNLAFDTTVYKAEAWLQLIGQADPSNKLVRRISSWTRKATADSPEALAFYFFKLALGRDATAITPPDSLSRQRLFAALDRAREVLETKLEFNAKSNPSWDATWGATWGSLFQFLPEGSRKAIPLSGGHLPEAGIFTPRGWLFAPTNSTDPAAHHLAVSGPVATRVVELSSKPSAVAVLDHAKGTNRRTFFRDRRELQKSSAPTKRLIF